MTTRERQALAEYEQGKAWQLLVDAALDSPPKPEQLAVVLGRWGRLFEAAEDGPAMEADLPEAVRVFFKKIGTVWNAKGGRPRLDQKRIHDAKQAWETAVYSLGYRNGLAIAQFSKRVGGTYQGENLKKLREEPSEKVIEHIASHTEYGEERLRKILKRK